MDRQTNEHFTTGLYSADANWNTGYKIWLIGMHSLIQ